MRARYRREPAEKGPYLMGLTGVGRACPRQATHVQTGGATITDSVMGQTPDLITQNGSCTNAR